MFREAGSGQGGRTITFFCFAIGESSVSVSSDSCQTGGVMVDAADRREARRFSMTLPMRVLPHDADGAEMKGQTRDVSYRGLYFLADAKFEVGSEIDFVLTLPQQTPTSVEVHIRCHGQIVRVEKLDDRLGIAAKIERYEFLPAAAA